MRHLSSGSFGNGGNRRGPSPSVYAPAAAPPRISLLPEHQSRHPKGRVGGQGTSSHRGQQHILPEGTAITHPTFVNKRVQKALILQHPHPPGSDLSPCSNHPVPGYQKEGSGISFIRCTWEIKQVFHDLTHASSSCFACCSSWHLLGELGPVLLRKSSSFAARCLFPKTICRNSPKIVLCNIPTPGLNVRKSRNSLQGTTWCKSRSLPQCFYFVRAKHVCNKTKQGDFIHLFPLKPFPPVGMWEVMPGASSPPYPLVPRGVMASGCPQPGTAVTMSSCQAAFSFS